MADEYISYEAALADFEACNAENPRWTPQRVKTLLLRQPAADVAPVRHGRWIDAYPDIEPNPMFMYGICSECGFEQGISKYLNYCPNCGAKMDGENNNVE